MARTRTKTVTAAQNGDAVAGGDAPHASGEVRDAQRVIERLRGELAELREQYAATSDILRAIASSATNLQEVLDAIAERAARLCGAQDAVIHRFEGDHVRMVAQFNEDASLNQFQQLPFYRFDPTSLSGQMLSSSSVVHHPDLSTLPEEQYPRVSTFLRWGVRALLSAPLLREGRLLGHITLRHRQAHAFTDQHVRLLQSFADQAVIAIENTRTFGELQERLDEQAATADILRAIASSPTNVEAVLATIVETVVRLADASSANVQRIEGDELVVEGIHRRSDDSEAGTTRTGEHDIEELIATTDASRVNRPWRYVITPETPPGRAVLDRRTIHIHDAAAVTPDDGYVQEWIDRQAEMGARTFLVTPLLRDTSALGVLGVLVVRRNEVRPFTDQQVALVETFARQAVIAIENARLFTELQERLEQQTATSDILRVIAVSTTDAQAVMQTILDQATRLCGATDGTVRLIDGDEAVHVATVGEFGQRFVPGTRTRFVRPGDARHRLGVLEARRAMWEQRTLYHPDTRVSDEPNMARNGILSQVYVPLPGEDRPLGFITIRSTQANAFSPSQIALVETFARQAAIAIKNTQLFQQLQQENARKQQELERARTIQQRLLPAQVPSWPGKLEVAYRFQPAVETSGDFYDVTEIPPTIVGAPAPLQIAVADTAGKGMGAALVMSLARAGLRHAATAPYSLSPAGIARAVSDRLHADVGSASFVACALATVEAEGDRRAPRLRLVNAGQVPVLLARSGQVRELEPLGSRLPLGAVAGVAYQELVEELCPGDVLVFCTDGLPEAPASGSNESRVMSDESPVPPPQKAGELFGFERLAQSVGHWSAHGGSAEAIAEGVWRDVTVWAGDESHHDDMTLLVLRVPGADAGR